MTTPRSFSDIIAELKIANASNVPLEVDYLRTLVSQASAQYVGGSSDAVTLLYSGKMPDGRNAYEWADEIRSNAPNGKVLTLSDKNVDVAKLINDIDFNTALERAVAAYTPPDRVIAEIHRIKNGSQSNGTRVPDGLWDDASRRFALNASGDVRILAPLGDYQTVLAQTEIPALLENPKVTHIDGVPISQLRETYRLKDLAGVQEQIIAHARFKIEVAGLGKGSGPDNYKKYLELKPDDYGRQLADKAVLMRVQTALDGMPDSQKSILEAYSRTALEVSESMVARGLSKGANKLGPAGLLVGFMLATNSANAAEKAGDHQRAKDIMIDWAADAAGSFAGEGLGAILGGIAVGALAISGVVISAPISGAIVLGATVLGGIFGGNAATELYNLTKDLDKNGTIDLMDKLSNIVFGATSTITTPLPADLNGNKLTLDASLSRDEMVTYAMSGSNVFAWRYTLRELLPFALTDVSLAQYNINGSLDIYDPATGKGELTEAYLRDRAAMLTWKIRYDTGGKDEDDYNPRRYGKKPYTEDWDTSLVEGNWDFIDLTQRIPGGSPLELAINGKGVSLHDHQVVFGSIEGEVINGAGESDRIYGMAGNDTIEGKGGDDYFEGGLGSDTYQFSGAFGKDRIFDADGLGRIQYGTATLNGGRGAGLPGYWVGKLASGEVFTYKLIENALNVGADRLEIIRHDSPDDLITIENFNLARAQSEDGYLGIKLDGGVKLALRGGSDGNPFSDPNFQPNDIIGNSAFLEGGGQRFTVYLSRGARLGETLSFSVADNADKFSVIVNGQKQSLSTVKVTLAAGQTSFSFTLVETGELSASLNSSLTVTLAATGASVASNRWGLSVVDISPGNATRYFLGDQVAPLDSDGKFRWGATKWLADGTLDQGVASKNFGDVIFGTEESETIKGFGGDDALAGGAGNDSIEGGDGNDLIGGGSGSDVLLGGKGRDYILCNTNTTTLRQAKPSDIWAPPAGKTVYLSTATWGLLVDPGQPGVHYVDGGGIYSTDASGDWVDAGADQDSVVGSYGDDVIDGGEGDDVLTGLAGGDLFLGGGGADTLQGDGTKTPGTYWTLDESLHGSDVLYGGLGNDDIYGQGGSDVLYGGADNDKVFGDDEQSRLSGAVHGKDRLFGELGLDSLYGGGNDDWLEGGEDNDLLWGDSTANKLQGQYHGNDTLQGGSGSDQLVGGGKNDSLLGGVGEDSLWGDDDSESNLGGAFHGNDYLDGGKDRDQLIGGGGNDELLGGSENDTLLGDNREAALAGTYHGKDHLDGGSGNDTLIGGGSDDTLLGGDGDDTIFGDDSTPIDLPSIHHGNDEVYGGVGNDQLAGGGLNDTLFGDAGNDTLWGDGSGSEHQFQGNDYLYGGLGNDTLFGGDGNDYLDGGEGSDRLVGGDGADTLIGERGDSLEGGAGDDVYMVESEDVSGIYDLGGVNTVVIQSRSLDESEAGVSIDANGSIVVKVSGSKSMRVNQGAISKIQYAGGGVVAMAALIADAEDLRSGDALRDILVGGENIYTGGRANEAIYTDSRGGADISAGGGNDSISLDGSGNVVRYVRGFGEDNLAIQNSSVVDPVNKFVFDYEFSELEPPGDSLRRFRFSDGSKLTIDRIERLGLQSQFVFRDRTLTLDELRSTAVRWTNSSLFGTVLADSLNGTDGNDSIFGGGGADTLVGGRGDDQLSGRGVAEVRWGVGEGSDEFRDLSANRLLLTGQINGNPIGVKDVLFERIHEYGAWVIRIASTGETLRLNQPAQAILFQNGDLLSASETEAKFVSVLGSWYKGSGRSDNISGGSGNDTVDGFGGADVLSGGDGDDYISSVSYENQTLTDSVGDTLDGGAGNDFLIASKGSNLLIGGAGRDTVSLLLESTGRVVAGRGDDWIDGGSGVLLEMGVGDGHDNLDGASSAVLIFGSGVLPQDVRFSSFGENLRIEAMGKSSSLNVSDFALIHWADGARQKSLGSVKFVDAPGVTWDWQYLNTAWLGVRGGAGNDTLVARPELDGPAPVIYGRGGDDEITGSDLADALYGGFGQDTLYGGFGDDSVFGEQGSDYISDDVGSNLLEGGDGNDTIVGVGVLRGGAGEDHLRHGYEAIASLLEGGEGNDILFGLDGDTLRGGVGNDLYQVRANSLLPLIEEVWGEGRDTVEASYVSYGLGANASIECLNLVGSGISGIGNGLDNTIYAGNGSQTLDGGMGDDTLVGGAGADTYFVDSSGDVIRELNDSGDVLGDMVYVSAERYVAPSNVEHVSMQSGAKEISVDQNSSRKVAIYGNGDNNRFVVNAGWGSISGGGGNDEYLIFSVAGDLIEQIDGGYDLVIASCDVELEANIEELQLFDDGTAAKNLIGIGNSSNNKISGTAGNNLLKGGEGGDSLFGLEGNDSLVGGDEVRPEIDVTSLEIYARGTSLGGVAAMMKVWVGDKLVQTFDVTSTAYASYKVTAPLGVQASEISLEFINDAYNSSTKEDRNLYIDKIVVSGIEIKSSAAGVIKDLGADLGARDGWNTYGGDSALYSNGALRFGLVGADLLDGGAGVDEMEGGGGNDVYVLDSTSDVIVEAANGGYDRATSSASYVLSANVEALTLTGSNAINGTGNASQNMLVGNAAANVLDGGAGNDLMVGQGGDDIYIVDSAGDYVYEVANQGADIVRASVGYTLSGNVEVLVLSGPGAINGTGSADANTLFGTNAANQLNGMAGNDTLYGDSSTTYVGSTQKIDSLVIYAKGVSAAGVLPKVSVRIDGIEAYSFDLTSTSLTAYAVPVTKLGKVGRTIDLVYLNDGNSADGLENRDLYIDRIEVNGSTGTVLAGNAKGTVMDVSTVDGKFLKVADGWLRDNGALRFSLDGSDALDGGAGVDSLLGGLGNDVYSVDSIADVITENLDSGLDLVRSTVSYTLADNIELLYLDGTAVQGTGNGLANTLYANSAANLLYGEGGDDLIHSSSGNDTAYGGIGNDWVYGHEGDDSLFGEAGNDYLEGSSGADYLYGGGGNDAISGGSGNDSYVFARGDGQDFVNDLDGTANNVDVLNFLAGVSNEQLWFKQTGNNLEISVIGTSDKVTVSNWYSGSSQHIEQFKAGGKTLLDSSVNALVSAMASMAPPATGTTTLPPADLSKLAPVFATSWQ